VILCNQQVAVLSFIISFIQSFSNSYQKVRVAKKPLYPLFRDRHYPVKNFAQDISDIIKVRILTISQNYLPNYLFAIMSVLILQVSKLTYFFFISGL